MTFLTPEQIEANWNRHGTLLAKACNSRQNPENYRPLLDMEKVLAESWALAPASSRVEHHNAFPGGLVDHSLRVCTNALAINEALGWGCDKFSIVICSLVHDLGKVAHLESVDSTPIDYYLRQPSDYKRADSPFIVNKDIPVMSVPDRGLYLTQLFGVKLTHDEWLAIKLHDGQYCDDNRSYRHHETKLSIILHFADYAACREEKDNVRSSTE